MKKITIFAATIILSFATVGQAAADSDHGHGSGPLANDSRPSNGQGDMMQNMMRMMMPMMMQMHGQMKGAGPSSGMSMMDDDMMRMMMGPDMMGAGLATDTEAEVARTAMLARLAEFDADGDGSLSLTEFEHLHAAMTREITVDRFQHLDADGDGRITKMEMGAPAQRMEMRRSMSGSSEMPGAQRMMDSRMPSDN